MHNHTFTWSIKDTNAVCGTNWGTVNCGGYAHGSAKLSTLRRLPSLSKPSETLNVISDEGRQSVTGYYLCVIKSPLKLWVTRVFPFSLTTVSKHCLLNYFALIPYLAKAAGWCENMWSLISEWGDSVPRPQVALFSVLHTNITLDFFFFCILLCVWETISTVTVCLFSYECLLSLVTFVVGMHVCWCLPEKFICGVSGLYNQGRNGWKIILGEVIKIEGSVLS